MKRGTGRTLVIIVVVSMLAAIVFFSVLFSLIDVGSMFSSSNGTQSSAPVSNTTLNYALDDSGFVLWLNDTNANVTTLVTDIRSEGQAGNMDTVLVDCTHLQSMIDNYLPQMDRFHDLTLDHAKHIGGVQKSALNN